MVSGKKNRGDNTAKINNTFLKPAFYRMLIFSVGSSPASATKKPKTAK